MKSFRLAFFFICALCARSFAQDISEINTGEKLLIGKNISFLIDSTGSMDAAGVINKNFTPGTTDILNFGNTPYNIWMKFSVKSKTERQLYLSIMDPLLKELEVYQLINGKPKQLFRGGFNESFFNRPVSSENFLFNLDLNADSASTFFIKGRSDFPFQVPVLLSSKDAFSEYYQTDNLFWGIYIGIMFFALIYNLIIFISVRERAYLYYILYIAFSSIFYLSLQGFAFQFLWPGIPSVNSYIPLFICFTNFAVTLFTLRFLQVTRKQKVQFYWGWVNIALFVIAAFINIAGAIQTAIVVAEFFSLLACIYYIYSGIVSQRHRVPTAKYFLTAWLLFLILVIVFILTLNNVIPSNFFTTHCIFIGHMTEVMLLSFALANRINWLKAENEKNQKEVIHQLQLNEQIQLEDKRQLEQKVKERTLAVVEQRNEALKQKKRSDELLLNILPFETAEELKNTGTSAARYFEMVTVMFIDIKDFTQFSEKLSPSQIVTEIHECFSGFDRVIEKFNLEKIKTIGDAYMAAGGLPTPNSTHAIDVINAALSILKFMDDHKEKKLKNGEDYFELRIGVHSGPVVAGIVGTKKFAYDIWGDTVNIASRMESCGKIGKVNITSTTYDLIKNNFTCTYRGKLEAKHKGMLDMFFVEKELNGSEPVFSPIEIDVL